MEKNVVSFVFKMTTKTQRGHYYMIKIYVMDTNVLIQSPNALFSFEDNLVVLPMVVLEELDHLKKADGETGANARKCIRLLEELRQKGNLLEGVSLENGGICWVEKNFVDVELPVDLSLEVADNRILKVCLGLKKSRKEQVVLVTKDILLRIKAQVLDLCAEDFISEQVIAHDRQYTGRCEVYAPDELFKDFKKKGIPVDEVYQLDENETYLIIDEAQNTTPDQIKGIITRAGKDTKIILLGDPNQIDRPFLDERTNGLSYAAEHMKGSPLCWQLTMTAEECERSELAMEAVKRL